ncbi:MAG: transporter [Rikenellaceae bacterium]
MMAVVFRALRDNRRPLLMLTSMLVGVIFFLPIARVDDMANNNAAPLLIFLMLFVTFCRVRIRDLRITWLHVILVLFQVVATPLVYYVLLPVGGEIVAQGGMVCFLAPIAMAAVAIGALLGANVTTMVSYTLICNLVMAFVAPIYLDLFGNGECTFAQILGRVVPLLLAPLVMAQLLKFVWHNAAEWIGGHSQMSFYMWLVSMALTLARTTRYIVDVSDTITFATALALAAVAFASCVAQYGVGRLLGRRFGDGVAGAQSLGQKNTVLTVWLSQAFLYPVSSIAPTSYIIWQNLVNSYQLYRHDRRLRK